MFIVLGSDKCPSCVECVCFLEDKGQKYRYICLQDIYGDNWRQIFRLLVDVCGEQKRIPLVFKSKEGTDVSVTEDNIVELAKSWTFIGGLWQAQEYVYNQISVEIVDNY